MNKTFRCKKCKSIDLRLVKNGPHQELICNTCDTHQKFLSKADMELFNRFKPTLEDKTTWSHICNIKPKRKHTKKQSKKEYIKNLFDKKQKTNNNSEHISNSEKPKLRTKEEEAAYEHYIFGDRKTGSA